MTRIHRDGRGTDASAGEHRTPQAVGQGRDPVFGPAPSPAPASAVAFGHHLDQFGVWPSPSADADMAEESAADGEAAGVALGDEMPEALPAALAEAMAASDDGADGGGEESGGAGDDAGADDGNEASGGEPPAQTTLRVTAPDDAYEQEADRLAESALDPTPGGAAPCLSGSFAQGLGGTLPVMRQARSEASHLGVGPDVEADITRARGLGGRLPAGLRAHMEAALGADFGDVRVHTDTGAHALSDRLEADAFATGRDLFFGAAQYDPSSRDGRRLIAHELTHVVQQTGPPAHGGAHGPALVQRGKQKNSTPNTAAAQINGGGVSKRDGTPTARAKKNIKTGQAVYDPLVMQNANQFKKRGGKNLAGQINIHAAHRFSDKGIRDVHESFLNPLSGATPTPQPHALPLVKRLYKAVWDKSSQTKAQNKKVKTGKKTLTSILKSGGTPTPAQMAQINQSIKLLSNDSVKNLYPGDASHNMTRGSAPDFRTMNVPDPNAKTGTKPPLVRRLTPTSADMAQFLTDYNKTYTPTKATGWAHGQSVPTGYTNSANPNGL